jgi:voltage-gated potassium channel
MNPIARFFITIWKGLRDPAFRTLLITVLLTILFGAMFYHRLEGWSILDALYFCIVTLTTVGDANLSPATTGGKIFTIFYVLVGIGILLGFVATVARSMGVPTPGRPQADGQSQKEQESSSPGFVARIVQKSRRRGQSQNEPQHNDPSQRGQE